MPLPVPKLDSRTWDELMAETRALVPRLAPGWTDHNAHDPGITLVELFAWLTELQLFELDRVSPQMLRTFLRLVGVTPRPAGVAETAVAVRQPPNAGPLTLPAGFAVCDADRTTFFESPDPHTVSPAWLELDATEGTTRGRLLVDGSDEVHNGRPFAPLGDHPTTASALWLGFTEPPGGRLCLYVWTAAGDPDPGPGEHYRARTGWEYRDGGGDWHKLRVVLDETRALSRSGRVVVAAPAAQALSPVDGRYWIRCRLLSGGYDCPPDLRAIAVNATLVRHALTVETLEPLGRSTGTAAQSFQLARRPVVAGSTRLRIVAGGSTDDGWQEVAEWDRTGPGDRHYRLDPLDGTVRFGDGRHGQVTPAGASIEAREYQVGGGPDGNVPAGWLTRVVGAGALLAVLQPYAATGGTPAEPLDVAHGRALDGIASPTRGVTAADLETLALATPGVPVGRAHAIPGHHPGHGCLPAAGVVTVVVLPRCGEPPTPSPELLDAVCRHLQPRRPLATELHVVGPGYVPVSVSATLHVARADSTLARSAVTALDAYFHPLTGGPDGTGWPFGHDVLESELLAMLNALPGIRHVDGLGISGPGDTAPRCGNLPLCPTDLVRSGPHHIRVEESER